MESCRKRYLETKVTTRRTVLKIGMGLSLIASSPMALSAPPRKLVFVHGRSQQGKDPVVLKKTWVDTFKKGAIAAGMEIPNDLEIAFPFYGDVLDDFTKQADLPLTTDIQARGEDSINEDFLSFQAQIAEDFRVQSGITE
jgi:hypothetical protein